MALLEVVGLVRERLRDLDAAVEVHHLRQVLRPNLAREPDRGFLRDRHPLFHAGARVDEERQRDREVGAVEEREFLLGAVLEDGEVVLGQVGHVVVLAVGHRHVERHELDARAEHLVLRGLPVGSWAASGRAGPNAPSASATRPAATGRVRHEASHHRTACPRAGPPCASSPGFVAATSMRSGGISVCGLAYTTRCWFLRIAASSASRPRRRGWSGRRSARRRCCADRGRAPTRGCAPGRRAAIRWGS